MVRVSRQPPQLLKTPIIRFKPSQGGSVTSPGLGSHQHHRPITRPLTLEGGWDLGTIHRCPSIGTYCLRCNVQRTGILCRV
eukprot:2097440-Prymnesium_polylepis.1